MAKFKNIVIFVIVFCCIAFLNLFFFSNVFSKIPLENTAWILNNPILSILLFFWLFIGMPALVAYFITFKLLKRKITGEINTELLEKNHTRLAIILTLVLGILITIFIRWMTKPRFLPSPLYTFHSIGPGELDKLPSIHLPSVTPSDIFISPIPTGKFEPTITVGPTLKVTSTPTPKLTDPPIINISYPSEMQSIEMGTTQTLCVVDVPAGGDTSGLQRRHNINDQGWSGYVNHFTLCFDPKEGLNRISLQYKNLFGDESVVYTRQFNFHRLENITVTISGQIYRDENCNGVRNTGESNISVSTIVRMFKIPEFYVYGEVNSNSSGSFSFSTTIREDESITLQPIVQSPSGYKSNPNYESPSFTLNSSNRSASLDYPQVPNEFVGACSS